MPQVLDRMQIFFEQTEFLPLPQRILLDQVPQNMNS